MHSVWGLISLLYWHSQESSPLFKTASGLHQEHGLHACLYIRVFCHLCVCVLLFAVAFLVAIGNTLTFFYKNMPLLQVHPWSQLSGFTVLADCLTLELVPSFTTLVGLQTRHKSRDFGFVAANVTSSGLSFLQFVFCPSYYTCIHFIYSRHPHNVLQWFHVCRVCVSMLDSLSFRESESIK